VGQMTTLMGGGHIAEFRQMKPPSLSPLWVPPWRTMEPYLYREHRHSEEYGAVTEGKLLSGLVGHNICLDYFGSPSPEESKCGLSQHGEAPSARWTALRAQATNTRVTLALSTELRESRLKLKREIVLRKGEPVAYFRETVINTARLDHFFHWVQHVTLGPPFLAADDVEISVPADQGMTFPHGYDEGKALLSSGKIFQWPKAPRKPRGKVDLSHPLSCRGLGFVVGLRLQAREWGFVAALNRRLGLLFAYCFRRSDYPWVALWEENRAIRAAPWRGRTTALGLEFGTTPLPLMRRENLLSGGPLFDVPTTAVIPARTSKTVAYLSLLAEVPRAFRCIRSITPVDKEIVVVAEDGATLRIPASGLAAF